MASTAERKERQEGDISSVFSSLSGEAAVELPARFGELKRHIIGDESNQRALIDSWSRLTKRLGQAAEEIDRKKQDCIPQIAFDKLTSPSSSSSSIKAIKATGAFVLKDVIDRRVAEGWLTEVEEYIKANPEVKGFPKDDKQVFELYWSKVQLEARSHPRALEVQKSLLNLFNPSGSGEDGDVSTKVPLSYADRLRIRHPGDAKFALGPHADGGSVERWEDPTYRKVYERVLRGRWEEYDPWQIVDRVRAEQNMYDGPGSCGVFRAFQGWTSLSSTAPDEGTLRVYPLLRELAAYTMLRPLFREVSPRSTLTHSEYLASSNWELDFESTAFPGSPLARCQEYNDITHPHLELERTMVSMPKVEPGDQAWWHCDMIHSVESVHKGTGPSAVLYIPAVPLTTQNIRYIKDQRTNFLSGRPGPDFPGGVGESQFKGRGMDGDITNKEGRQAMGLEPFELLPGLSEGEQTLRRTANEILGF
ncbi:uncharacterized protein I303_102827 [Kwoniella dejecticola CBS 10117]|uniref:DUF1479-domain-containing protein n=1 Tax=Kwoniella dejecticola CBS 10117 TaxID=1296121 RepID=A0A1A6A9U4_9TREE|nr:uncharacterized protein I303_02841 [Kwoniella dejecticola CBS 10117]OBR86825.1 hypothetical protein I303_02841 [Kwoniella dejecticola CBS 10117]